MNTPKIDGGAALAIDESSIIQDRLSGFDGHGFVFRWSGRLFRAVEPEYEDFMRKLMESGMVSDLHEQGFLPKTQWSRFTLGTKSVLEHEEIGPQTFPFEWTFGMLRDAAKMVLEVNERAATWGYELKDCHPYNVIFSNGKPFYVDIGSFVRKEGPRARASDEFRQWYIEPLRLAALGHPELARHLLSHWQSYGFPLGTYRKLTAALMRSTRTTPALVLTATKRLALRVTKRLRLGEKDEDLDTNARLRSELSEIAVPYSATEWTDYQPSDPTKTDGNRFSRFAGIIEWLRTKDASSGVDLAGNRGLLSVLVLQKTQIREMVTLDRDESASDSLYQWRKQTDAIPKGKKLDVVTCPLFTHPAFARLPHSANRLQADVVFALALTHHLLLSQAITGVRIIDGIAAFTRKWAVIEFMPLGLWNGASAPPVPSWYSTEWFSKTLSTRFKIDRIIHAEDNRIQFFCEKLA